MKSIKKQINKGNFNKKITRKEAIKKAGVTALAATSLVFLQTKSASACSCDGTHKGNGYGGGS